MEITKKFYKSNKKTTKEDDLATEIYEEFKRKVGYSRIRKIINEIGWSDTNTIFRECLKRSHKYNVVGDFLNRVKERRKEIIWID